MISQLVSLFNTQLSHELDLHNLENMKVKGVNQPLPSPVHLVCQLDTEPVINLSTPKVCFHRNCTNCKSKRLRPEHWVANW